MRFLRRAQAHALAPTIPPPMHSRGTRLLLHRDLCSSHARGSFGTRRVTPAPKSRLATQPRRPSLARGEQFRRALASSLCARCVPAVSSDHRINRAPSRFTHTVVSSNVPPRTGMPRSGRHPDTSFAAPQALPYPVSRHGAPAISRSSIPCPAVSRIPAAPATPTRPHLLVCSNHATKRTSGALGQPRPARWKERLDPLVSPCMRLLASLPHRQRDRRQALLAELELPFISRIGPFRLTPITRIRRQPPTAAEPPPRPAPSMARIARSLPKRATAGCLSSTAGNLSQIPGRTQRERHSCRKEFELGVSCHQRMPQAVRRIARRAQSAALARIAGRSLRAAGRYGRVWITRPE